MSESNSSPSIRGVKQDNQALLFVNKVIYRGWKSVNITRSINSFSSSFSLELTDKWSPNSRDVAVKPGDLFHLHVDGTSIMDGYLDSVSISAGANEKTISVNGRSRAADLVDCSYDGPTQFKKTTMKSIVEKLVAPFGIATSFTSDPGEFNKININQGETVASIIGRMCLQKKLIVYTTYRSNLIFTKNGFKRATNEIIEGENLISGSVTRNNSNRFSKYTVKSQGSSPTAGANSLLGNVGEANDPGITRFRPKVIVSENFSSNELAIERANYEASKASAEGTRFKVVVQGWRQSNGDLWDVNQVIALRSPALNYSGYLLCESVTFTKSQGGGTTTTLGLVRSDAYQFEPIAEGSEV